MHKKLAQLAINEKIIYRFEIMLGYQGSSFSNGHQGNVPYCDYILSGLLWIIAPH